MIATFVKKEFSKKDWEFYSKVAGYMFLDKSNLGTGENNWAAFSCPTEDGQAPTGMYLLDEDELRRYDLYCKGNNHHPQPFQDKEIENETPRDDSHWDMNKEIIRDFLQKKKGMFKV